MFIVGAVYGKVRALFDDHGRPVKEAGPSTPVEVLGLQGVPEAGKTISKSPMKPGPGTSWITAKASGVKRRWHAALAHALRWISCTNSSSPARPRRLPVVVKADVQGSVEVLSEVLPKLSTDAVKLKIIHASVGAVTETDVLLASASGAIIFAFNVRPDRKASDLAQRENVEIRPHTIIYEVTDEIKRAMTGLLEPVFKETHLGRAEVRNTFRIKGVGMIAGCMVVDGVIKRDAEARVLREGVVVYTGRISSLQAAPKTTPRKCAQASKVRRRSFQLPTISRSAIYSRCFSMQKLILALASTGLRAPSRRLWRLAWRCERCRSVS